MLGNHRVALTPAERARRGGNATAALHDPQLYTAPARAAFLKKFEDQVDPDGSLPEAERQRLAAAARRAHMLALASVSARVRRERAG